MYKIICTLMLVCFSLTSCCTVSRGTTQPVHITSTPGESFITIDGYACGTTPQTFALTRKHSHEIILEKEGYEPQRYLLQSKMTPQICWNGLAPITGGLMGAGLGLALTGGHTSTFAGVVIAYTALGGLIFGLASGVIAAGVDAATGSSRELSHNQVHGIMKPQYLYENNFVY